MKAKNSCGKQGYPQVLIHIGWWKNYDSSHERRESFVRKFFDFTA